MKSAMRFLISAVVLSTIFMVRAEGQTYTTADVISSINRLGGFTLYKARSPEWEWLDTSYLASVTGTVVTIQLTVSDIKENARTGATCTVSGTVHTILVFDIRDIQSAVTVSLQSNSSGYPNDKRSLAVLKTKSDKLLVRQVDTTDPPTCPSSLPPNAPPADIFFQPTKSDSPSILLWFSGYDAALQFQAIVASAWQ
jgi:hypothetical protein